MNLLLDFNEKNSKISEPITFFIHWNIIILFQKNIDNESSFIIFGIIFHALSLSATSYIEEEHMIYYHLSSSYLMILFLGHICKIYSKYKRDNNIIFNDCKQLMKLICSLAALRFFRDLNSVGDKYQNAYDYSDWLNENDHIIENSIIYIFGKW